MTRNKKGLSNVIATVLIILLALAAVAIVWGFLQGSIEDTGTTIDAGTKCFNTEVKVTDCTLANTDVTVQLTRGGDTTKAIVVLEHSDGTTDVSSTQATFSGVLDSDSVTVPVAIAAGDTARVAPVVKDENGADYTCDPLPAEFTCT